MHNKLSDKAVSSVAVWSSEGFNLIDIPSWQSSKSTIVKVIATGVCGTDFHIMRGRDKSYSKKFPISLGHEILAKIVRLGSNTNVVGGGKLKVGERVIIVPGVACGSCEVCLSYKASEHLCANRKVHGFSQFDEHVKSPLGGFSTFIELIDNAHVCRVPSSMSAKSAVLGELVAVAVRAVERGLGAGRPEVGLGSLVSSRAAVLGIGPLGCCVALVLKSLGANVIAFERNDWRVRYSRNKLGINSFKVNGEDTSKSAKEGKEYGMFDVVFECAGEPSAFSAALLLVRKGGRIVELGHFISNGYASIDPSIICRNDIEILGSVLAPPLSYVKAIKIISNFHSTFEQIVTKQISLNKIDKIMRLKEQNHFMKVIIVP